MISCSLDEKHFNRVGNPVKVLDEYYLEITNFVLQTDLPLSTSFII